MIVWIGWILRQVKFIENTELPVIQCFERPKPDLNFAPYVLYIYSCYETRT